MMARIFLAVPSYRPTPEIRAELDTFASALGPETVLSIKEGCSIIEMARATLEERFLATDCTHILWKDDDIRVEVEDIQAMLLEGLDVVGLGCRNRHCPEMRGFNVRALHHGGSDFTPRVVVRPSGRKVIEAAGVGFGCILVRRNVVERLWKKHIELRCESLENAGQMITMTFLPTIRGQVDGVRRFVGEDLSWCDRARANGFRIYAMLDAVTDHGGLVDVLDENSLRVAPVQAMNRAQRRELAAQRRAS